MKILFVQPDSLNPVINNAIHIYNFEPLGLYYLAATVKDEHDVDLLDLNVEMILSETKNSPFHKKLLVYKPDIVVFSALTSPRTGRINELCSITKGIDKNIITIVGGVHASLMPSDFNNRCVDIVIRKNSIENFRRAIHLIEKNEKLRFIKKIIDSSYYNNGKTCLDSWPEPYRELGKRYKPYYKIAIGRPGKSRIMETVSSVKTSSGCPFRCNFCCLWQLYPMYEKRDIDSIVSEIEKIDNEYIFFADDESMIDSKYMMNLADAIIESGLKKKYIMYARADTIARNAELLKKWALAGLKQIWIGIEGATNSQLNRYEKDNTTISHKKAIEITRSFNIDVHATILIDQSFRKEDFEYMLKYTKVYLKLTSCHFFVLTPFRGSRYYYRLLRRNPEKFLTQNPDHFSIRQSVIQPKHMSIEEFHKCYADLQRKFNSNTIPFEFHGTFEKESYKKEFEELVRKNEILYKTILTSHLSY